MRTRTTRIAIMSALALVSGLLVTPVITAPAAQAATADPTAAQPVAQLGSPTPQHGDLGDEILVPGWKPDSTFHATKTPTSTRRATSSNSTTSNTSENSDATTTSAVHSIYISVANVTTTTKDNHFTGITTAKAKALVAQMNSYWHAESGGAATLVFGGFERRTLADTTCSPNSVLSEESESAFDGLFADYGWMGSNNHLLVVTQEKCGSQAFGTVGGNGGTIFSSFGIAKSTGLPFMLHEFGHNLGLRHADSSICKNTSTFDAPQSAFTLASSECPTAEYDDYLDIMGYSVKNATPHVSSPQLIQLGFLQSYSDLSADSGTTTIRLKPLAGSTGTRAIRITDPTSGDIYYVEYRAPVGADKTSAEFKYSLHCDSAGSGYSRCNLDGNKKYGSVRVLRTIEYAAGGSGTTVLATGLTAKSSNKKKRHTHLVAGNRFTAQDAGFSFRINSLSVSKGASITVTF